ncbi:hypothetical protein [Pseudanabaena mucicola]|nr:hypothetical protein [Pseudanabaena mucicola]
MTMLAEILQKYLQTLASQSYQAQLADLLVIGFGRSLSLQS